MRFAGIGPEAVGHDRTLTQQRSRCRAVDLPNHRFEVQQRLGVPAGEGISLLDRSDRCILGVDVCATVD